MFADGRPRIVNIKGIRMDAEFGPSMIYITNLDKPGFIGRFSSTLGEAGINIATFHVGREAPGGNAIALIEIDGELPGRRARARCARCRRCSRRGRCSFSAGAIDGEIVTPCKSGSPVGWVEPLRNPSPRGFPER